MSRTKSISLTAGGGNTAATSFAGSSAAHGASAVAARTIAVTGAKNRTFIGEIASRKRTGKAGMPSAGGTTILKTSRSRLNRNGFNHPAAVQVTSRHGLCVDYPMPWRAAKELDHGAKYL